MTKSPRILVNALIGKAVLETLFVAVLAVVTYSAAFPPTFHGWGEVDIRSQAIAGWAVNNASPWQRVEVQLFVDGVLVSTATANQSRPDVAKAGWAKDEWHGYQFRLQKLSRGLHEARVYAVHASNNSERYTMQLLGDPINFQVDDNGRLLPVAPKR